jgi:Phage tail protein (Tail_P2_I).
LRLPDIKFKFWMGRGELTKFAKGLRAYWGHVEAALKMPLQQHDPLTAPMPLVRLLAWQRDISPLEREPEEIFRIRVAYAYEFARHGGEVDGFHNMFEKLGIDWIAIHERQDPVQWDVVTIETADGDLAQKSWLMNAMIRQYGRTCRRYRFNVTYPVALSLRTYQFSHAFQLCTASALNQVTLNGRERAFEHNQQLFIATLESKQ